MVIELYSLSKNESDDLEFVVEEYDFTPNIHLVFSLDLTTPILAQHLSMLDVVNVIIKQSPEKFILLYNGEDILISSSYQKSKVYTDDDFGNQFTSNI